MTLSAAARAVEGVLRGGDAHFRAVCTDSRVLSGGELFVALRGPNFDGHDFLEAARRAGVAGAIVSRAAARTLPCVCVPDTRRALGRLAADWRGRFDVPVIGVTGSNGKTTVKEMLRAILARRGPGLVTEGNLNNEIGLPLTLLRLREHHRYAVVEMGMNHAGEIATLTGIARPDVAVITNAAQAHLEGLGTVGAVARAKGEIFSGLRPGGCAVLNADDPHLALWRAMAAPHRCITFGYSAGADVRGVYDETRGVLRVAGAGVETSVRLALPGAHNGMNALAALCAARAMGVPTAGMVTALQTLAPVAGRLRERRLSGGALVLDDTYNANPASVAAAIAVLRTRAHPRVLVFGDMGELGEAGEALHRRVGEQAAAAGIDQFLAIGPLAAAAAHGFGPAGRHFDAIETLLTHLRGLLAPGVTVLVKGSRASRMERVVEALSAARGAH